MKTKLAVLIITPLIFFGCAKPEPNVKDYSNPLPKNQQEKEFLFRENSADCKLFSYYMVSGKEEPYQSYSVPYPQQSGSFTLRDTTTGDRYTGTYRSTGNFATGFANGAALGAAIKRSRQKDEYQQLAYDYCMIRYGWRKTKQ